MTAEELLAVEAKPGPERAALTQKLWALAHRDSAVAPRVTARLLQLYEGAKPHECSECRSRRPESAAGRLDAESKRLEAK